MTPNGKPTINNYREWKEYPRIVNAVKEAIDAKGWVSPIDVFLYMDVLSKADLANWRQGRVLSLEKVIRCNLSRCGRILRILGFHAHDLKLKPSQTVYKHKSHLLRFSRSGEPKIEEAYSRHFVKLGKSHESAHKPADPPVTTDPSENES